MFYVTAINGKKVIALLGPYDDHSEAIANVDRGKSLAIDYDKTGRADFAGYGTVKLQGEIKTAFGK